MRLFLTILTLFISFSIFSQKVENVKTIVEGDKVTITYDLTELISGDTLFITIYPSDPLIELPLRGLSGDVGKVSGVGKGKKIVWMSRDQIVNRGNPLSFDVRAELVYRFVLLSEMKDTRRGKKVLLKWNAWPDRPINIQLVKDNVVQYAVATSVGKGEYTWKVPSGQTIGSYYQLRFANESKVLLTDEFKVKHRIPTLVKFLPLVGLVLLLPKETKKEGLPGPPGLGLN
jgi:hypothetical protein